MVEDEQQQVEVVGGALDFKALNPSDALGRVGK